MFVHSFACGWLLLTLPWTYLQETSVSTIEVLRGPPSQLPWQLYDFAHSITYPFLPFLFAINRLFHCQICFVSLLWVCLLPLEWGEPFTATLTLQILPASYLDSEYNEVMLKGETLQTDCVSNLLNDWSTYLDWLLIFVYSISMQHQQKMLLLAGGGGGCCLCCEGIGLSYAPSARSIFFGGSLWGLYWVMRLVDWGMSDCPLTC